jgi:GntR family transcriptional repressor for pyruvate dehydrogenase complex
MTAPVTGDRRLQRTTLLGALADDLEEGILSGELQSGSRLPAEGALAQRYGVSRAIVREALVRLRERGLIETLNGTGTFVRRPDTDHLAESLLRHLRAAGGGRESVVRLYEARRAIETATARLAAEHATPHDHEQLALHLEEMRSGRADAQRWTAADLAFHHAVAAASHNPFLAAMLAPLARVISIGILEGRRAARATESGLRAHETIRDRIGAKDADGAQQAMLDHLLDSERRYASVLASSLGAGARTHGDG